MVYVIMEVPCNTGAGVYVIMEAPCNTGAGVYVNGSYQKF